MMQDTISPQKLARHQRFWQKLTPGEGGYLAIECPLEAPGAPLPPPKDLEEQWLSCDYALRRIRSRLDRSAFLLDALPTVFVNLGPGVLAAMLGGGYALKPDTVWFDTAPILSDFTEVPPLALDRSHTLYQVVKEQIHTLAQESGGAYKVSFTDIGGTLDILASLRGNQDLLTDLLEYPEEIAAVAHRIDEIFMEYFDEQAEWLAALGAGYTNWIPLVHDRPWYPLQCDLSAMISPALFERLVLPSLDYAASRMDAAVYHLDGPGEIPHLDRILSLPGIHAIQWVPLPEISLERNSYRQNFADEMSLSIYRRVLAAGRKVVLCGVPADQVPGIYRAVGPDGVFIFTSTPTFGQGVALASQARQEGWVRL